MTRRQKPRVLAENEVVTPEQLADLLHTTPAKIVRGLGHLAMPVAKGTLRFASDVVWRWMQHPWCEEGGVAA